MTALSNKPEAQEGSTLILNDQEWIICEIHCQPGGADSLVGGSLPLSVHVALSDEVKKINPRAFGVGNYSAYVNCSSHCVLEFNSWEVTLNMVRDYLQYFKQNMIII